MTFVLLSCVVVCIAFFFFLVNVIDVMCFLSLF